MDEADIDELFAAKIAAKLPQALAGIHFDLKDDLTLTLVYDVNDDHVKSDRWQVPTQAGFEHHLAYCQQFWQELWEEGSVEAYYQRKGIKPAEVLAALENSAAPWCTVAEAKQVPAEQHLLLFGTASGERYLDEDPGRVHVVSIADKTRMVFIYAVHGLDVFKLQQMPPAEQAYRHYLARGKAIHVMPEVDPLAPPQNDATGMDETSSVVTRIEDEEEAYVPTKTA